jgi:hypothetical protein
MHGRAKMCSVVMLAFCEQLLCCDHEKPLSKVVQCYCEILHRADSMQSRCQMNRLMGQLRTLPKVAMEESM